jgi:hypothetical protein
MVTLVPVGWQLYKSSADNFEDEKSSKHINIGHNSEDLVVTKPTVKA